MRDERVYAGTVTYGNRTHLLEQSLLGAFGAGALEVIVLFNGNGHLIGDLRARFDERTNARITVLEAPSNLGSAGGFGSVIDYFCESTSDGDWLWLLDDDNVPETDALTKIFASSAPGERAHVSFRRMDFYQAQVAAGAAAAVVYPHPGQFLNVDIAGRFLQGRQGAADGENSPTSRRLMVPTAPYGGLLLERSILRVVHGPRREFFLYEDDTEFGLRVARETDGIVLHLDSVINDIDGKWSEVSDGGMRGLLNSSDAFRLYVSIRNRVRVDRGLALSVRDPRQRIAATLSMGLNAVAYTAKLTVLGLPRSRRENYKTIMRAMAVGLGLASWPGNGMPGLDGTGGNLKVKKWGGELR